MSDPLTTDHFGLPYLAPAQAQKHVTHNEALRLLDAVVQLAVLDASLTDPPGSPATGDRYIVAAGATGDWAGHDGEITTFADGAWAFAAPEVGWLAFDRNAGALLVRQDDGWEAVGGFLGFLDRLGVNAIADDTNRLSVRSNAVLFAPIDTGDGGTGDVRFVVDKESDGDTASLLFQTGFSGRAEIGLAGDTDFVFKVSPDGTTWIEAIRIAKDTGLAAILYDNGSSGLAATTVQAAIDEVAAATGGGGVTSVFGRTGAVGAALHDYDASQVDNDSGVSGSTVKDALDALATLLGGKQGSDSDLTALAGLSATGLIARTGSGTAAARTLTAPAAGISVSNGDGISGNPTLALANDLAALEGLSATGLIARTADGAAAARTLTAPAAGISVSNGDGVSGNPTLALANDLAAVEGLGSTGIAVRTAADTWAQRSLAGTAGQVSVANGDGVSGNPTVSLDVTIKPTVVALTDGATPALDASLGTIFRLAAGGDRTIAVPSNPTAGQKIVIQHYASGAARALVLNTGANGFRYGADITGLTQTASGKTDYIGAIWNATDSKWDVVGYVKGF